MDKRIEDSIDYINNNIDLTIKVSELAKRVFLSPKYFRKIFKEQTNYTPTRYIEKLKMSKCKEILETTELQVLDTSIKMGFLNYETFTRAFKRYYGVSPSDYKSIVKRINRTTSSYERIELKVSSYVNRYSIVEKIKKEMKLVKDSKIIIVSKILLPNELNNIKIKNKYYINEHYV